MRPIHLGKRIRFPQIFARACAASAVIILAMLSGCTSSNVAVTSRRPVALTHDDFALADANHDGALTRREAGTYLVYVIFTNADTNGDRRLTEEEFIHGEPAQTVAFRERDANGDGILTLREALEYGRRGEGAAALMRHADRNHDGKLNRAELDAYLLHVTGAGR